MKQPKFKFGEAVVVEWEDAHGGSGWRPAFVSSGPLIVREIGFFRQQNKGALEIFRGYPIMGDGEPSEFEDQLGVSYIPAGMVRSVRKVRL